jgi:nucleoside-diphosphate-sugar epimerase
MALKKLFITGTTGYIGGTVLGEVLKRHGQELAITALLRSPSKEYSEKYPNVTVVKGSFDDFDVISKAASEADIVIRMCTMAMNLLWCCNAFSRHRRH